MNDQVREPLEKGDYVNKSGEWLSLGQAAALLGVHPSTVRSWADQGRLPVHRTHGGHRRFRRIEIDLYQQADQAKELEDVNRLVQNALLRTRLQISEGRLEGEKWYSKLDAEARSQYRQSGRTLMQGLLNYLSGVDDGAGVETRALGYEYASRGYRRGLSSAEAVQAFLFFRTLLLDAMLTVYEEAGVHSAQVWGSLFRKVNTFTDQILFTLIETYEAYQRNSR